MGAKIGACGQITKISFVLLNILFMLIGLTLVGLGSYLVHSKESLDYFTGNTFLSGAAIIIACGIVVFLITTIGIGGAIFQIRLILIMYVIFVVIVIALEIIAGILGFVYRNTLGDIASDRAADAIRDYRDPNRTDYDKGVNDAIDLIQKRFECCGWNETDMWEGTPYFEDTGMYPKSCECPSKNSTEPCIVASTGQLIFNQTCSDGVTESLQRNVLALGIVGVVFGVLQIFPVILAIGLCCCIHRSVNEYVKV